MQVWRRAGQGGQLFIGLGNAGSGNVGFGSMGGQHRVR